MLDSSLRRPLFAHTPLYAQIRDHFRDLIASGEWAPGKLLESEIDLAAKMQTSIGTMRKALDALESEGLVRRRQGRGTMVIDQRCQESGQLLNNLCTGDGVRLSGAIVSFDFTLEEAGEDEVQDLQIASGERVFRSTRTREHCSRIYLYEKISIPERVMPRLKREDFAKPRVVLNGAREHKLLVSGAWERVDIGFASDDVALALGVSVGKPLLRLNRLVFSTRGKPIGRRVAFCDLQDIRYSTDIS